MNQCFTAETQRELKSIKAMRAIKHCGTHDASRFLFAALHYRHGNTRNNGKEYFRVIPCVSVAIQVTEVVFFVFSAVNAQG
jgi:hypothetical protein